ncbi:MAG: hypothetical protein LN568_06225 [Rickettsia endosymbiont of Pseudomimeciton antennatum]|nr:hypothetical protein [Rickettsia endosymbiont of Pseudomimeciton antennatum]MCC8398897.1 hypothetical protein [Rickettsia endosymbiont of Labidopullus appendiculatus]
MKNSCLHTLLISILIVLVSGCVGKDYNKISTAGIDSVTDASKALILIQTTPIVPSHNDKAIATEWENLSVANSVLYTKNYRNVYITPNLTGYKYHSIELYLVTPGEYVLKRLKYTWDKSSYTFSNINNIATFSVKGGDVLYIGNLTIDIKGYELNALTFLNRAISIQDNYEVAKQYINKDYPHLSTKLQKKLIMLQNKD